MDKLYAATAALLTLLSITANASAGAKLGEKGFEVETVSAGKILVSYPQLGFEKPISPSQVVIDGNVATLKYPAAGQARIEAQPGGAFLMHFTALPADVRALYITMTLPVSLKGVTWQMDKQPAQPLPVDFPGKPFLFQGVAHSLVVREGETGGFALVVPPSFQQLQDNRQWHGDTFLWFAKIDINPNPPGEITLPLKIFDPTAAEPAVKMPPPPPVPVQVDRFGQHINKDFPEKVQTDDELKQDVQRDSEYYDSLHPPATDPFGGLPGSGEKYGLKKTGFFHVENVQKVQTLVDPDGNAFFQLGVCDITPGDDYTLSGGRRGIFEWLPSGKDPLFKSVFQGGFEPIISFHLVNLVRKYGKPYDPETYTRQWIDHLRKWGFNSGGAWALNGAKPNQVAVELKFPTVDFLATGAPALPVKEMWDPFADGLDEKMDAAMAKQVGPQANNPLILGYFLTNEPSIEEIPKAVPGLKGSKYAAKRRLVQMLKEKYPTIDAFNTAWDIKAGSFDELNDLPLGVLTKTASQDMQTYYALFLEQRYGMIEKYFRKHDPNHLLIGDRWMPGTANSEPLVRIAGKHLDVLSVNYYAYGVDKSFLARIHEWSGGKPMILSEFYYAARDQGLSGGTVQVASQEERGLAYRNYVEQAASTGFVVGIQWFEANDQATTGRFFEGDHGEAGNTGLVNVADRPYKKFLDHAIKTNWDIYSVIFGKRPPFAYDDPRFTMKQGGRKVVQIARMTKPVVLDGQRTEWPGEPPTRIGPESLVLGQDAKDFEATYRLAWDDDNLYVFIEVTDTTPMQNREADDSIWANDAIEMFTGYEDLDIGGSLGFSDRQTLIRGGPADGAHSPMAYVNAPKKFPPGKSAVIPGLDGKSYIIEAAIPFEALGFHPKSGQEILFDLCVDDGSNGRRQLAWNGTARDSKDRGSWGKAEFTN